MPDSARAASARRPTFTAATLLVAAGVVMASLAIPSQVRGATFTFAPTADAYVSSASTSTNFGTQTTLQVGISPTRWSYLKFNVVGLGGAPTSATLRLWAVTGGGSTAKTAASTWTETGLTYVNKPTPNASPTKPGTSTTGTYISYDVTGFYTTNGSWTFQFSSAAGVVFASREDAAHAPQLTVVGPGAPTVPRAPPVSLRWPAPGRRPSAGRSRSATAAARSSTTPPSRRQATRPRLSLARAPPRSRSRA